MNEALRMLLRRALFAALLVSLAAPAAFAQPSDGGGDASREQQRLTSAESYIPMPTLSTAVITNDRARGLLVVDFGVDVSDTTLRGRVNAMRPRLIDAVRSAVSTYASTYYRDRTAPDPDTLSRLMQTAVDRTMGRQGVRLLLSNIVYQRRQG